MDGLLVQLCGAMGLSAEVYNHACNGGYGIIC